MTKELKAQLVAWGLYFAFLAFYVTVLVTGNEFLSRHLELIVNIDLWVFTLVPAIFAILGTVAIRCNFPEVVKQMRAAGATEEQIRTNTRILGPKITGLNYLSFISSGVMLAVVFQLGFPVQAIAMWLISITTQAVMIMLPLKKVDDGTSII